LELMNIKRFRRFNAANLVVIPLSFPILAPMNMHLVMLMTIWFSVEPMTHA